MEQWLKDVKDRAKTEAECFVEDMKRIAEKENLDSVWFIEEVVKNIHTIKETNK